MLRLYENKIFGLLALDVQFQIITVLLVRARKGLLITNSTNDGLL